MQIRKAESDDIPELRLLFNSYTSPPKSAYFFQWWNSIPSVTFCATSAGKIVGMFVVLKRKLVNNLNCGVLMGLIVAKGWRGSGLFRELGVTAMNYFEDIDLFCCLTNAVGRKALEKNFHFRTAASIETMTLSANAPRDCRGYTCTPVTSITTFNHFESDMNGTLMFLADEEFRRWRFAEHHRHSYNVVRTDSNEFAVTNKYHEMETNIRYGDIVDFEPQALEEETMIELIACACASLKNHVDVITIQAIPNSLLHTIADKIGFVESSAKHYLCLKLKDASNEYLLNPSDWLIKWGDYLR